MDWGFFMSAGNPNKAQVLFFAVIIFRLVKLMAALSTGSVEGLRRYPCANEIKLQQIKRAVALMMAVLTLINSKRLKYCECRVNSGFFSE
jgi:hypothetical protein